jgi:hypothetical protein
MIRRLRWKFRKIDWRDLAVKLATGGSIRL